MTAQEVCRDAVQPGSRVRFRLVVPLPACHAGQEGLSDQVVSDGPDPPAQVPVQTGRMRIEQARKDGGRVPGTDIELRHRFCAAWFHHRSHDHVLPGAVLHVHGRR